MTPTGMNVTWSVSLADHGDGNRVITDVRPRACHRRLGRFLITNSFRLYRFNVLLPIIMAASNIFWAVLVALKKCPSLS